MEELSLKEFREQNKTNTYKSFKIICLKCKSENVLIEGNYDYSMGSEYTGIYGEEIELLFKCKDCGNAWGIIKEIH